ncbi:hypothetical protein CDAR_240711 [Caerostris darwini]|uniref:Uncharacterized protein n=1 Tax=Caerostris darwini TaxID=1538125 RepID=A0AAV4RYR7_9ARAC|nr:hypothetical protein CDAR_240711 [Caerostris darwini]
MYGFIKINNTKHVLKTKKEERERKNSHFPRFARSGLDITSRASDSRLQSSLAYGRSEMHFCKAEGGEKKTSETERWPTSDTPPSYPLSTFNKNLRKMEGKRGKRQKLRKRFSVDCYPIQCDSCGNGKIS